MDEAPAAASSAELVEDLFRKEYAHLVSALTRVLGPTNSPLAEDVVHDALVSAMQAWRFGFPHPALGGYPADEQAGVTVLDKLTYVGNLANLAPVAGNPRLRFVQGDSATPPSSRPCSPATTRRQLRRRDPCGPLHRRRLRLRRRERGRRAGPAAGLPGGEVARVVQVSTDEVYGSVASGSWAEDAPLDPNSPYSAAKAGGDLMARAYARTHGLDVSITRCCNNYGPYQFPEKVIPLFVTNLLDGLNVPLYGDGGNVRGWIHVDDHCQGIQLVLEQGRRPACTTSTATRS